MSVHFEVDKDIQNYWIGHLTDAFLLLLFMSTLFRWKKQKLNDLVICLGFMLGFELRSVWFPHCVQLPLEDSAPFPTRGSSPVRSALGYIDQKTLLWMLYSLEFQGWYGDCSAPSGPVSFCPFTQLCKSHHGNWEATRLQPWDRC